MDTTITLVQMSRGTLTALFVGAEFLGAYGTPMAAVENAVWYIAEMARPIARVGR